MWWNLIIINLQNKEGPGGQDVESLIGRPESQDGLVRLQTGHLLLGDLTYLTTLFAVEQHRLHGWGLPVDERTAQTLAVGGVGEVWSAGRKLFVTVGRLDVACKKKKKNPTD